MTANKRYVEYVQHFYGVNANYVYTINTNNNSDYGNITTFMQRER